MNPRARPLREQVYKVFREERFLSLTARQRYLAGCLRFVDVLAERTHLQKLRNLGPWHVEVYVQACREKGLKPATIKTDLAAIQFLHDMLRLSGKTRWGRRLPTASELGVEPRVKVPNRAWTPRQLGELVLRLAAAGERQAADMLVLGWELGLRLHEVLRLDRAQAEPHSLERGYLAIKGKGGKVRKVPLTGRAVKILERSRRGVPRGEKLFVRPGETTAQAMKRLQRLIEKHRPDPLPGQSPLTFHGLRYTYAQRWHRRLRAAGMPVRLYRHAISVLLGHNREDITDLYTRPREVPQPRKIIRTRRPGSVEKEVLDLVRELSGDARCRAAPIRAGDGQNSQAG